VLSGLRTRERNGRLRRSKLGAAVTDKNPCWMKIRVGEESVTLISSIRICDSEQRKCATHQEKVHRTGTEK
jgi:hypothetical protein